MAVVNFFLTAPISFNLFKFYRGKTAAKQCSKIFELVFPSQILPVCEAQRLRLVQPSF